MDFVVKYLVKWTRSTTRRELCCTPKLDYLRTHTHTHTTGNVRKHHIMHELSMWYTLAKIHCGNNCAEEGDQAKPQLRHTAISDIQRTLMYVVRSLPISILSLLRLRLRQCVVTNHFQTLLHVINYVNTNEFSNRSKCAKHQRTEWIRSSTLTHTHKSINQKIRKTD